MLDGVDLIKITLWWSEVKMPRKDRVTRSWSFEFHQLKQIDLFETLSNA